MARGGAAAAFVFVQRRLVAEMEGALKRRPLAESHLSGAVRVVAPYCAQVRSATAAALDTLIRRASFDRELYAGAVRALVECGDRRAPALLRTALAADDAGGLAGLSAACFSMDPSLAPALARTAGGRHAHLALAAEVARVCRKESPGVHLAALAAKIKESHRIALCVELFVPLVRAPPLSLAIARPLAVLRDAERHLGRWLVLAEIAAAAGDPSPLAEARARSGDGPASARAAWSLVAWALDPASGAPTTRPTTELVARLSDRPSSDRDTTFLFRLADARAASARPMLEALVRQQPLADEVAVRAAKCLARDYGRDDLRGALRALVADPKREELRGLAAAALWDAGDRENAIAAAEELAPSKALATQVWSAFVRNAAQVEHDDPVVDEARFRRIQWGWVE